MPSSFLSDNVPFETKILNQVKYAARVRSMELGPGATEQMRLDRTTNTIGDLYYELSTYILKDHIQTSDIVKTKDVFFKAVLLDGPFQRWKCRHQLSWWLGWFVSWRPLKYLVETETKTVTLKVTVEDYATFPHSDYVTPSDRLGSPVFYRNTSSSWVD